MSTSEKTITEKCDFDQNSLAHKYINMKYSSASHSSASNRSRLIANFDASYIIRLVKHGLSYLENQQQQIPVDCALDVGCGQGHMCRVLIKENLAKSTLGIDKSKQMIEYAAMANSDDLEHTQCRYMVVDAINDDLSTIFDRKFSVIVQSYMLCFAENVQQLSKAAVNIARVCSGIFVGLIPNFDCDYTSEAIRKLLKYGIKFEEVEERKDDSMMYQLIFEFGTENEFAVFNHCYSDKTYERVFREAGFKHFEWMPPQVQTHDDEEEDTFLFDLLDSKWIMGFIAVV